MDFYQKARVTAIRIRHSLRMRTDGRTCGSRWEADGGKGSGNWGHKGRPGKVGGSSEGGGVHNRKKDKDGGFTSFSKRRKDAAKLHAITADEIGFLKNYRDIRIVDEAGSHYRTSIKYPGKYKCVETGEIRQFSEGDTVKFAIPKELDPSFSYTKEDRRAMELKQEQFDKAIRMKSGQDVDDEYREQSGKIWKGLDAEEKSAFAFYTDAGYIPINDALRTHDKDDLKALEDQIDAITGAIEQSEIKSDTILRRGITRKAAETLFGLPEGFLANNSAEGDSMIGRTGTDEGFMSTGGAEGTGLWKEPVQLEILAPKGTKGLYCEPFSEVGDGDGIMWDGEEEQDSISDECEILLQRGTTLQVIGYEAQDMDGKRRHIIRAVIVRQEDHGKKKSA